ncbi:transglycosylase SLT domain-containing protein [Motilimonas cestriensis]|uniref:Transglycosylase SLT domain-containing protein n=1 Tax=Motilimonas cestriensis TaxID=2742685 RepID=A0ABS8W3U6_9GAMM|nr:transglycosylase SLT domain-containing protein [Motilimonas cestriensis]MCE2593626.1 transglycosylase SLT domain-containing protein [Motilimonas cestriensis]
MRITLVSFLLLFTSFSQASSLSEQRSLYSQALEAQKQKDWGSAEQLRKQLGTDYPLALFLEYNALKSQLSFLPIEKVQRFSQENQDSYLANTLERQYLFRLAAHEKWHSFLKLQPQQPNNITLQCHYYNAQMQVGEKTIAWQGAEKLWLSGQSRPDACDPLFASWKQAGKLSQDLIFERMVLAFSANKPKLMAYLQKSLTGKHQAYGELLTKVYANPKLLLNFNDYQQKTTPYMQIVAAGLERLIAKSTPSALKAYRHYGKQFNFTQEQRRSLELKLIQYVMYRDLSKAFKWADKQLAGWQDATVIEQRIRYALAQQQWSTALKWIELLPSADKNHERWKYWQARLNKKAGRDKAANVFFAEVAKERSYYGFMSAQQLGVPYSLNIEKVTLNKALLTEQMPVLARISELLYHGADNIARTEWGHLISRQPKPIVDHLGQYALEKGWLHFAVLASIETKSWDLVEQRFPQVEAPTFNKFAKERQVDSSFLFALARQESAFYAQARSPVGARGLMQLMPATAKYTAKKIGVKYEGVASLYDPEVNVRLGSAYIKGLLDDYNGNRILASAAYNAGPNRVKRWRANSPGLAADVWVEIIPFRETRGYVQSVLAYNVVYQHQQDKPMSMLTKQEWQTQL